MLRAGQVETAVITDANSALIGLFQAVVADVDAVAAASRKLFVPENNTRERYDALRVHFNELLVGGVEKAALFLYLNRHCFNGVWRSNRRGKMNMPFGSHPSPKVPEAELRAFATQAIRHGVEFRHADFRVTMAQALPGDIVYCDPPYYPASDTASFVGYAAGGFTDADQADLAAAAWECAARGATVLITNADVPAAHTLYRGAEIVSIQVHRSVSCKAESRGKVGEILAVFAPFQLSQMALAA